MRSKGGVGGYIHPHGGIYPPTKLIDWRIGMERETSGIFKKKRYNFAMVCNTALQDNKLSLKAKGLYSLIQSLITLDRDIYKWQIKKYCSEGNKAFENAWKELKENGYLKVYRMPIGKNNAFCYEYELLDIPDTATENVINLTAQS